MMSHVPSRPTLPLTHRPTVTSSRHVIASPFDIPSLSYVTTSTQSRWPDLINSSDSRGGCVNSSSVGCVGGRAMMREPVTASHHQPQPTVFPSNPEPFQGTLWACDVYTTLHCNVLKYILSYRNTWNIGATRKLIVDEFVLWWHQAGNISSICSFATFSCSWDRNTCTLHNLWAAAGGGMNICNLSCLPGTITVQIHHL